MIMASVKKVNKFVKRAGTELWAFTVKTNLKNGKNADEKTYEKFFRVLHQLSEVITYCGEVDSKLILHYHGVIRIRSNFYRKSLCVKGYYLYLKRIYRLRNWVDYCFKNNVMYCFEKMKKCEIGKTVFAKKGVLDLSGDDIFG